MTHTDRGLGRRFAPDDRDYGFQLQDVVEASTRTRRLWGINKEDRLDQGSEPHCVAYAHAHRWLGGPRRHDELAWGLTEAYKWMQQNDEWAGENYEGTSVRAGAKYMRAMGHYTVFRWAWDLDTVINAVLEQGPVVMGTNWYTDMFWPDENGFLRLEGFNAGGHAWIVDGVDTTQGWARMLNSWGTAWGKEGRAKIDLVDLDRLIHENGEACMPTES